MYCQTRVEKECCHFEEMEESGRLAYKRKDVVNGCAPGREVPHWAGKAGTGLLRMLLATTVPQGPKAGLVGSSR